MRYVVNVYQDIGSDIKETCTSIYHTITYHMCMYSVQAHRLQICITVGVTYCKCTGAIQIDAAT